VSRSPRCTGSFSPTDGGTFACGSSNGLGGSAFRSKSFALYVICVSLSDTLAIGEHTCACQGSLRSSCTGGVAVVTDYALDG